MTKIWALVPAAGIGTRMGQQACPKQYLPLLGSTVIEHSLATLLQIDEVQQLVVALHPDDHYWHNTRYAQDPRVQTVTGGKERANSVLAGLQFFSAHGVPADAWILVHDAARPCVRLSDINNLIASCCDADSDGGLLAMPAQDSMKLADDALQVAASQPRERLWHALTPQLFRLKPLQDALERALQQGLTMTDESSAMELAGYAPKLVEGQRDNIKITQPSDLALAAFFLSQRMTS